MWQRANFFSQCSHCTILFGHSDVVCLCSRLLCISSLQSSHVTSSYLHKTKWSWGRKKRHFRVLRSQLKRLSNSILLKFMTVVLKTIKNAFLLVSLITSLHWQKDLGVNSNRETNCCLVNWFRTQKYMCIRSPYSVIVRVLKRTVVGD